MTLEEHIDNIRNGLERRQFTSETAVRQGIINPLLEQLGWPASKTQIVFPEYAVESGKVDYALCHPPGTPRIFIEAKQLGKLDGAERQLFTRQIFRYIADQGVRFAILTDGRKWIFFYPAGEGTHEERKVIELDLRTGNHEENTYRLNRYLNYESVQTGRAFIAIEEDYRDFSRQRELAQHLPGVWHRLLEERDQVLLQLLTKEMKKVCRYTPTETEILAFLESLTADPQKVPVMPIPEPPMPDPKEKKSPQRTRLVVTMPNGEIIECSKIKDTFFEVIEKLGVEKVAALGITRSKIPLVSDSEYSDYSQRQSGSYYVYVGASTINKKRDLIKIAEGLRVELKVEIIPKD